MTSPVMNEWELAEARRSAFEASRIPLDSLVLDERQLQRYLAPPADTPYSLEYSYHLLGDVEGKAVLEYGCGDGLNSVALSRRGAKISSIDISPELIEVARRRMAANGGGTNVEFVVGSAHDLPFPDETFDVVFGIAILHHLDLDLSAKEVHRVLKKGGKAIFQEPVRNSPTIKFVRGLIPYRAPDVSPYERPLTDAELRQYSRAFSSHRSRAFNLPSTSLISILPRIRDVLGPKCPRWDASLIERFPSLSYYATVRVIELVK